MTPGPKPLRPLREEEARFARITDPARWTTPKRKGRSPRAFLADLYRERMELDLVIERTEAEIEHLRKLGLLKRERIEHGDESAYQRHIRQSIPFAEDDGGAPCGCRLAHARYERARSAAAADRRHGQQVTIYDALREA